MAGAAPQAQNKSGRIVEIALRRSSPFLRGEFMKYLLLVYGDEKTWMGMTEAERDAVFAECSVYGDEITKSGHMLAGAPLERTSTARTIRRSDGKSIITDGPFAETREVLAGYHLVECRDMAEAVAIGERFPGIKYGMAIEVRALMAE
jgi:hypothetical protein